MLLVCLIWGANFSVVKGAFEYLPALAFTGVRFALSSAFLYVLVRWRYGAVTFPAGLTGRMIWLGVLGNTLYQIAFTLALLWSTATNTALILATMPAVVTLLAGVRRIERVTPRMWAGTALATLGVALVISTGGIEFSPATLKGDACAVAAVIFWSVYTLGLRRIPHSVPPLTTTALTTLTGTPGLVLAGLVPIVGVDWVRVPAPAWGALAYSSFLSLVVAYFIWNASVQRVGGTRTAIYMCLTPVVAALTAWATLGERLVPLQGVGAALILTGVLMTRK
ncbi:MAG TPA: DMT family transporter [Gemmatimonadales bacterium]|jgi:drug/metabolite transporter (DMT)-like permease